MSGSWWVLVAAALLAVAGVQGLRYGSRARATRRAEVTALLARVAQTRQQLGVDRIADPRERRAQQITRGARPAMAMPVSDPDAYLEAYDADPGDAPTGEPAR